MQISPIPTLSDEINDIRTRTANIVAEKIIPNEKEIYSKSENSSSVRKEISCLLYTSPSPRDIPLSRMPSSA